MTRPSLPKFLNLATALREFVTVAGTQSQQHIRPIHRSLSLRLALEGGFHPEEIVPRPPLRLEVNNGKNFLHFDLSVEGSKEMTILGGLKSKALDVVVARQGAGPMVGVSVKGTGNAFRNLTNRMEEAVGDATNLHIMYPGLVYGFLHFMRANREGDGDLAANDIAVSKAGEIASSIRRYHDVLLGLAGRRLVRDDITRYEAVAVGLVEPLPPQTGTLRDDFPSHDSPLHIKRFFAALYETYDLRFPYVAAAVPAFRRLEWDPDSPALEAIKAKGRYEAVLGYAPRVG
jgi:hypothetical protein